MASKDSKTSKTARVMNLLSKKQDAVPAEDTTETQAAAPAPASAPVPPIITSLAPDAAVSVQIKNALEDALEDELSSQPPAPRAEEPLPQEAAAPSEPEPVPPPASEPPAQPVRQAEPEPAPQPEEESGPQLEIESDFRPDQLLIPDHPGYVNVMQVLVEEKAPKYVKMFGLCQCQRCLEDVKALALNRLPSKYVVLEPGDLIPRLTVYEGKFSSDITAQLLYACKAVMETPHHGR